jgi:hypothetical protein
MLLGCGGSDAAPRPAGAVAQRAFDAQGVRWRAVDLPERGLRLYLQRRTAADRDARAVEASVAREQAQVLALLGEPAAARAQPGQPPEASLFFLGSRDDMRRLTGRPIAGFVQPGEPTAFFVWSTGYRAPLRHELTHLYTFQRWGAPRAGEAVAWLVEGIAAWAGGPCQGRSPDALAAGLLARGMLPSAARLARDFRALPEDVAMPAAGSLVGFLHGRDGIDGLRARWRSDAAPALPDSATEAAWRAHVAAVAPATLDVARVMREGC